MDVHFSSKTDLWGTPQDFFDKYNERYQFTLDVCATDDNAKCPLWITKEQDGLIVSWHKYISLLERDWNYSCWMNPPYGREISKWMEKAYEESKRGCTVVCLVPSRTDTRWWHDYAMKGDIEFIKGRLKFGGSSNSAPFPSAVVVFKP